MQPLWQPLCITTYQRWYSQSAPILVQHYVKHQLCLTASSTHQHTVSVFAGKGGKGEDGFSLLSKGEMGGNKNHQQTNKQATPQVDYSPALSTTVWCSTSTQEKEGTCPKIWGITWNPRYDPDIYSQIDVQQKGKTQTFWLASECWWFNLESVGVGLWWGVEGGINVSSHCHTFQSIWSNHLPRSKQRLYERVRKK